MGALQKLEPELRRVMLAVLIDNKRFNKIAEEEEVALSTVHYRYKKGLSIISEQLQKRVALDPEFARAWENSVQAWRNEV